MLSDSQRAALAARLRRGRETSSSGRIVPRPADLQDVPASFGQEQLWFLDRFAPAVAAYNVPVHLRLQGQLDVAALGRAADALLARHESLRTRLVAGRDSRPVQVIDPPPRDTLRLLDFSSGGRQGAWRQLEELASAELARPFALADGPLIRMHLVRMAAEEHVLVIMVHHAVFDGWSSGVLISDLVALYAAEATDEPSGLDELPVQFGDYAVWQRQQLEGPALAELEQYWRGAMHGFETIRLPTDRPRPSVDTFAGTTEGRPLPVSLLASLQELSRREGTTLFVTLMAALQTLLYRYTGQTDLVVGTTSANRSRSVLAPMIGFLVTTVPIRGNLAADPAFTELLAQLRETTVGAFANQDLPFAKLVETLQVERDASRPPVVQLMFNLVEAPDGGLPQAAGVSFVPLGDIGEATAAKFDISLFAFAAPGAFALGMTYSSALFDAATIARMLENLEVLLHGVVADPSARLSQLPLLTPAELHRELTEWNDTAAQFPAAGIHQGFEAQASRTPAATAVQLGDSRVSYDQLNRWANQIAGRLRAAGVGPEVLVAVCMSATPRRLAALLGILKAGGGYLPLDPALPAERLAFMLADAGTPVLLADEENLASLPETDAELLSLDADWPAISALDDANLAEVAVSPQNAAYVIYTSGSTGQPKGVVIEHRQAVNFAYGMISSFRIGESDAVLAFASLSFDVSVMDMFVPLLAGGRVVLVPPETLRSPPRLAALIREAGVTYACLTPSVLSLLTDYDLAGLRSLVSGGEELPSELVRAYLRPGLDFYNTYGPTEAAVVTTWTILDAGTQLPPPIGRPLPNYRAYVLDARLNPVPVGAVGELHIGGAGVARGYLNRPELTQQKFIGDPFRDEPGARLYKSGDLVRRRADGSIVFVGRADSQVKIRGLRIELGEIEAALAAHPAVSRVLATVATDPAGEKQLAAYLCPEPGAQPDPEELRGYLARTLPGYLIPAYLTVLAQFPLNASGKIDRAALPDPLARPEPATGRAEPVTYTETALAAAYAAVLGREQVGATDGFFAIGGSSLQVMRLVDLISKELGVDVGVATIFLHPSPRQLAAQIELARSGTGQVGGSGPLVELSSGVGELPLFLIHAVGGTVFAYAQLAGELAGTFAVYGLEAPGLSQDDATAATLDGLADDYTERIRAAQPAGPYRLAGWSMGGVVAFEVARRLEQAGQQVCLLALLDAPFAQPDTAAYTEPQLAAQFLIDATRSLGWGATAELPDPATSSAAEQLAWLAGRLAGDGGDAAAVTAQLRRRFEVFVAHIRMLSQYQPEIPAVQAPTLIVSADRSPNAPCRAHWPRVLAGPVSTQSVDSDHYTFLRPPLVAEVGTSILKWHDE
jgi:amino acid adenylation domain-containing protein